MQFFRLTCIRVLNNYGAQAIVLAFELYYLRIKTYLYFR